MQKLESFEIKEIAQLYQEALDDYRNSEDLDEEDRLNKQETLFQLTQWYHGLQSYDENYV
jgi:hypothetical protein